MGLILENRFSEAKIIVSENFENTTSERTRGARSAIEGIVSRYSTREAGPLLSAEYFPKLKRTINEKCSSIWSDDYDKGYFSVWKELLKIAPQTSDILNKKERVIENPGEKE